MSWSPRSIRLVPWRLHFDNSTPLGGHGPVLGLEGRPPSSMPRDLVPARTSSGPPASPSPYQNFTCPRSLPEIYLLGWEPCRKASAARGVRAPRRQKGQEVSADDAAVFIRKRAESLDGTPVGMRCPTPRRKITPGTRIKHDGIHGRSFSPDHPAPDRRGSG